MIPFTIIQVWIGGTQIPLEFEKTRALIRRKHATWKYVFVTDKTHENFVKTYFPDFYNTYVSFPYTIQRADAIRYMYLYVHGGVYMDLDYTPIKPLDDLVANLNRQQIDIGLKRDYTNKTICNSFIVSAPRRQFWLKCIQSMKTTIPKWYHVGKHMTVMHTTGPLMLNRLYKENGNKDGQRIVILKNISVPCSTCDNETCTIQKGYYLMPIQGKTWHSWDSTVYNRLLCYRHIALICLVVVLILILVLWRRIRHP